MLKKENKKVLVSGVKPSGKIHIGNYFGAIKQFVELQDKYKTYIFIADYHALISVQDKKIMQENILDLAMDYIACGIDPKKVVFFKQSDVLEHTELSWIFSTLVSMPYMARAHAFKDAEAKNKDVSAGLFSYPILMAADILMYNADIVPVGKDQQQHLEITRDIANKFNNTYKKLFKKPKEYILKSVETVLGTDGQKMSKSYGNTIPLFQSEKDLKKQIMSIPMDSKGIDEKKNPNDYNLYKITKLFASKKELEELEGVFKKGGVGYKDIKEFCFEIINAYLKPMREKRQKLEKNKTKILKILEQGGKKAKKEAQKKMEEVRKEVGISFYKK
ncbi:tryptophan--tRNA ligase [Candidatus Campbellbacteria bacterium]|nr:MAG: tryptophan--tRNA ligase [Candidatus Campbellbacteria bacterium]